MNKKEIAEIKRQFKMENKDLAINRIAIYYINQNNEIVCSTNKRFADVKNMISGKSTENFWGQIDEEHFIDIFKKTLNGQLGKGLVEFYFKNEEMLDSKSVYAKLDGLHNDALEDKDVVKKYVEFLVDTLNLQKEYAICLTNCTYNIPTKDINGDKIAEEEAFTETYDFTLVSLCNIELSNIGLYYNTKVKTIEHKSNEDKIVCPPFAGFLYPTFSERTTDTNSVLVFNKKPKEPLKQLIEGVLGCTYLMDPEQERDKFNTLITKVITNDSNTNTSIDYSITTNIYEQIKNTIENNVLETEMPTLSAGEIKKILEHSGVEKEKLEKFDDIFIEEMGNEKIQLKAVNLIDSTKLDVKSPDISIKVKSDKTEKLQPKIIDGKKYLMVEIDETVEINGLSVKIK